MAKQPPIALQIDLLGSGPFQLPILVQIASLKVPEDEDQVVAEFLSHDGKRIFAAISYRAAEQLVKASQPGPLKMAASSSAHPIDLEKPAAAYELPPFSSFQRCLQSGPDHRTLILLTDHGQRVLFPLVPSTYNDFIQHLKAALIFYQRPSPRH